MTSSGKASWFVGDLVMRELAAKGDEVSFLFTDVRGDNASPHAGEDPDNYRFLVESVAHTVGATLPHWWRKVHTAEGYGELAADYLPELVWLNEGRDIWQVFKDDRFLGNSRLANCSKFLKQKPARDWLDENCDPADTTVYVGIDITEIHRLADIQAAYAHPIGAACTRRPPCRPKNRCTPEAPCRRHRPCTGDDPCGKRLNQPWIVRAPLCETTPGPNGRDLPRWLRGDVDEALAAARIAPPLLYATGAQHANCGGGCVRGGHQHFRLLLETNPDRYRYWEEREQDLRDHLGKNVAILKDRTGGSATPLTLRRFREDIEDQALLFDPTDFMGCGGCFVDYDREDGAA